MNYDNHVSTIKTTATINVLAGIWLFVSPWVYQSYAAEWNNWIVGALIVLFAAIRLSSPFGTRGVSIANFLLGAWTFASPWIYGYAGDTGQLINSLCIGVIVFVLGVYGSSVVVERTTTAPPPVRP
jgi:hypothetical protein